MADDKAKTPRAHAEIERTVVYDFGRTPQSRVGHRLQDGALLNHIYEVKYFITRGGTAEVYKGVNIVTEEDVAIKILLPHLAEDPAVEAMFLREARTVMRLSHPALVPYRLAAREPTLSVNYLVTEFVNGPGLDHYGRIPSVPEMLVVIRRLADAMRVLHEFSLVHRDLSPDNIMLPDGRLDQAKIIDFGIAKDLGSTAQTILGFAGKLNYAAPEQLGDFSREIGAWTDIYSLGLVMLELATGQDVQMGANVVEAVDRRRAGVDVTHAPAELQSLFAAMLQANPTARLQSMGEVIDFVDLIEAERDLRPPPEPQRPRASRPRRPYC